MGNNSNNGGGGSNNNIDNNNKTGPDGPGSLTISTSTSNHSGTRNLKPGQVGGLNFKFSGGGGRGRVPESEEEDDGVPSDPSEAEALERALKGSAEEANIRENLQEWMATQASIKISQE